jgi:SSS family solute:Na+ symporter
MISGDLFLPALVLASATDAVRTIHYSPARGLGVLDWVVIGGYVAIVLGQGWYYSRTQTTASEFLVASRKPMSPGIVGLSLYATLLSTITYLAKPGEIINKGPVSSIAQIASMPIVYIIVAWLVMPIIMARRVTSVYEYLEERIGTVGRLAGAGLFLFLRVVWMGLMIYLTSVVLTVVMGLGEAWVPLLSIIVGLATVLYSTMGGFRAVVMTDTYQASLMFLGAIATVVVVSWHCRGFSWIPTEWSPSWDVQPLMSFDPHVRVTVIGGILHMTLWRVATVCGDQTAIQRYMAVKDLEAARRSVLVTTIATIVSTVLLSLVGLALLGFFGRFAEALPPGMNLDTDADKLLPFFITHYLPVGVTGLVVTAFLAAAMSSIDSGVSAVTAVVETDFLSRWGLRPKDEKARVRFIRWLSVLIGILVIGLSFVVKYVPGNVMEVTNKTSNLVTVPIFGLFIMAWFVPFVTPLGAMVGTLCSVVAAVLIGFWDVMTGQPAISFQYIGMGSLAVSLAVGCFVSRMGPRRHDRTGTRRWAVASAVLMTILTVLIVTWGRDARLDTAAAAVAPRRADN